MTVVRSRVEEISDEQKRSARRNGEVVDRSLEEVRRSLELYLENHPNEVVPWSEVAGAAKRVFDALSIEEKGRVRRYFGKEKDAHASLAHQVRVRLLLFPAIIESPVK